MPKKSESRNGKRQLKPSEKATAFAKYIAIVVRNSMEDFHSKYLSDEHMKELNPIIRDAICTALYASEVYDQYEGARCFVDLNIQMIPDYWEDPKLTDDFLGTVDDFEKRSRGELSN
jgi:hypothetical protein